MIDKFKSTYEITVEIRGVNQTATKVLIPPQKSIQFTPADLGQLQLLDGVPMTLIIRFTRTEFKNVNGKIYELDCEFCFSKSVYWK